MTPPERAPSDLGLLRRLLLDARACWPHIAGLLALGLLAAPLSLLTPLPLKIAVDSALGSHALPAPLRALVPPGPGAALAVAVGLLLATALLKQVHELSTRLLRTYAMEKLALDLRARLFRHAQRLSVSYHDRQGSADFAYRIVKDVPDTQSVVVEGLLPSISAGLSLLGMLAVTVRLDPVLAVVALVIVPPLLVMNQHYRPRFRARWREVKSLESSALSVVQEVLGALRVVKAFGQEEREHQHFLKRSGRGMGARLGLTMAESGFGLQVSALTALGAAAVLWVGVRHVQAGLLTLGELLLVMAYLTQLYEPLKTLSKKTAGLQSKLASAERVFSLLDRAPDVVEHPEPRPLRRARAAIAFQQVSFAYDGQRPALEGVSFELPPGARLGIAGPTGAGKTTLIGLLMRFHDPTAGRVLLDGVDVREYRLADLRRQFAPVLQEPVLFSVSVAENIAYARPEASPHEIVQAATAAGAHDFIAALPQGYETVVGERGMSLSGGERQRISLARAFLKDSPILVLDEPTSAIDLRTEALILEALGRLMHGRTTLMVAHRPSTLQGCNLLLELHHGRTSGLRSVPAPVTG